MNKFRGSILVKVITWIVLTISVAGFVLSAFTFMVFESEDIYKSGVNVKLHNTYTQISDNLATRAVYDSIANNKAVDLSKDGFYYMILKKNDNNNIHQAIYSTFGKDTDTLNQLKSSEVVYSEDYYYDSWQSFLYTTYYLRKHNNENNLTEYVVWYYVPDSEWSTKMSMSLSQIWRQAIQRDDTVSDYKFASNMILLMYSMQGYIFYIGVICFILMVLSFILLLSFAGYRKNKEGIVLTVFDKWPLDVFTVFIGLAITCCIGVMTVIVESNLSTYANINVISAMCIFTWIFALWYILSIAVRIKNKNLFRNSIIYYVCAFIGRGISNLWNYISTFWAAVIVMVILIIWDIAAISTRSAAVFFFGLIIKLVAFVALLKLFYDFRKLRKAGKQICDGNLEYKVDTRKMYPEEKQLGEALNNISDGLNKAVDGRMKSEKMKTELITNVSHDIKTPLTSIINYVDLLQKEEIENEKIKEYVEVLERQASRLKKLIEDLVEASKASTGNLAVNMETIDASVMISQVAGEFEEKLAKSELELIVRKPESPVEIKADGRHLWRVIDNLINNICKYAQPNSRVYIDLEQNDTSVKIILRNISKYQLNINGDELLERFVRGDESRNTEGHGLGLSIAKSLMELMGGSLDIHVDGDLFKVILSLNK